MSLAEEKKPTNKEAEKRDENKIVDMDLDLSPIRKKKIRIDGDNSRILELDIADMKILSRLTESYPKLEKLSEKAAKFSDDLDGVSLDDEEEQKKLGNALKTIDKDMRKIIDTIFDTNTSEVCAPSGCMFDLFNGTCRYEYIISSLMQLYEDNISKEAANLETDMKKHTQKYTSKKKA